MAIQLATQFLPYVDEKFSTESKISIITNKDFSWTGAHTVNVYKVSTAPMNDYDRTGTGSGATGSRYGAISGLDADVEEFTLKKDRSFTFAIDKLDIDETKQALEGAKALSRQLKEVVIPEIDTYTLGVMCAGAGHKPEAQAITPDNVYDLITAASAALDDAEAPETGRVLVVTPQIYRVMKQCQEIVLNTDVGQDMRVRGVISNLDGAAILKVPAARLPESFGFMLCHPVATVAPQKLEDYKLHADPPGISGSLAEGRFCYDAFVLDNKKNAIYYQQTTAGE